MKQRWASLCLVVALATATSTHATTVVQLPEDVLFRSAAEVLVVHVIDVQTIEMPVGPGVFTDVSLLVEETIAGTATVGSTVVVRVPGGNTATRAVHVEAMPEFRRGEALVVFLERLPAFPDGAEAFLPLGLNQGVWRLGFEALYRATWQEGLVGGGAPPTAIGLRLESIRTRVATARRSTP